jgi:hypothetical protein
MPLRREQISQQMVQIFPDISDSLKNMGRVDLKNYKMDDLGTMEILSLLQMWVKCKVPGL